MQAVKKNAVQRQVVQIPVNLVVPNPNQPRKYFSDDNLFELARSISQYGLLQPISVRKIGARYELVAGERRLRACMLLGMTQIDAIITEFCEYDSAIVALIENVQRENLHFLEEAESYLSIIRQTGISQEELARRVGKNQCTVANKIRILKLPGAIKREILANGLVERQARALLRLHDERLQSEALSRIVSGRLNVKETDELIEKMLEVTYSQPVQAPKGKLTTLAGDTRLYLNSFKDIVRRMSGAGFSPQYTTVEENGKIEIRIVIPLEKDGINVKKESVQK